MYKRIIIVLLCFLFLFPFNAYASIGNISAQSAVAMDSKTGCVLYNRSSNIRLPIASTTKIMTCLIACESGNIEDIVTVTAEMLDKTEGSLIYLKVGDKISLEDLIKGAMLASGNDAANAIAVHLGNSISGFRDMMNSKAKKLKMYNTHFVTPSGLDEDEHYSTAYDMALLACYAMNNKIFSDICRLQSAEITISNKPTTIYNHNRLLSVDNNYCGVKTGFTSKSGRCLVSAYKHNDSMIIIVTLNAPDDWEDHRQIKNYAVKKYNDYSSKEQIIIDVVGGKREKITCDAKYKITACKKLRKKVYYYPFLYAPVYKGSTVGRIDFYCGNNKIESVEITASESVEIWTTKK